MKIDEIIKKICSYPYYCIILTSCLLLVFGSLVFNNNVWLDEVITFTEISISYSDLLNILSTDVHPPLYFMALKLFCDIFGYNILIMKIFSVLGCVSMMLLGAFPIRKAFGDKTSLFFMILCLCMPFMMHYSTEIRMYSWVIFFVTASFVYAARIIQTKNIIDWVLFFIFSIAAAYTHTYALMSIAVIGLLLGLYLLKKRREDIKKWILTVSLMIIAYLPWITSFLGQLSQTNSGFWITFSLSTIISVPISIFSPGSSFTVINLLFVMFMGLLSLYSVYKILQFRLEKLNDWIALGGICVIAIVFGFATIYSIIIQPVLVARYIMVMAGIGLVILSIYVPHIKNKKIIASIIAVLIIAASISYISCYQDEYNTGINEAIDKIERVCSADDALLYDEYHAYGVLSYYMTDYSHFKLTEDNKIDHDKMSYLSLLNGEIINTSYVESLLDDNKKVWLIETNDNEPTQLLTNYFNVNLYREISSPSANYKKWSIYQITPSIPEMYK